MRKAIEALSSRKSSLTDRDTLLKLGLWDMVFDTGKYIPGCISSFSLRRKHFIENQQNICSECRSTQIFIMYLLFKDVIPELQTRLKDMKPWLSNKKDLEDEIIKLGINKKDLNLGTNSAEKPIYLDVVNNPVDRVRIMLLNTVLE